MASLIRLLSILIASGVLAYSYSFEDHEIVADVAQELIEGTRRDQSERASRQLHHG